MPIQYFILTFDISFSENSRAYEEMHLRDISSVYRRVSINIYRSEPSDPNLHFSTQKTIDVNRFLSPSTLFLLSANRMEISREISHLGPSSFLSFWIIYIANDYRALFILLLKKSSNDSFLNLLYLVLLNFMANFE